MLAEAQLRAAAEAQLRAVVQQLAVAAAQLLAVVQQLLAVVQQLLAVVQQLKLQAAVAKLHRVEQHLAVLPKSRCTELALGLAAESQEGALPQSRRSKFKCYVDRKTFIIYLSGKRVMFFLDDRLLSFHDRRVENFLVQLGKLLFHFAHEVLLKLR